MAVFIDELQIWPSAEHDRRVAVERDVGAVKRVLNDHHIFRVRYANRCEHWRPKIACVAKAIAVRPDVVARIDPGAEACAFLPTRLRRQRSPADVIIIRAPRNPRRTPRVFRHPNPAFIPVMNPAPVMIRDPAPILVAHPSPARIRVSPVAIRVRRPVLRNARWSPATPVVRDLDPFAERREHFLKIFKRDFDFGAGGFGKKRSRERGQHEGERTGVFHKSGAGN